MVLNFDKNSSLSFSMQNISLTLHLLMEIYLYGNKGHFHSHTGCFPFLPIPNFVINFHSMGFPWDSHFHWNSHCHLWCTVSR